MGPKNGVLAMNNIIVHYRITSYFRGIKCSWFGLDSAIRDFIFVDLPRHVVH